MLSQYFKKTKIEYRVYKSQGTLSGSSQSLLSILEVSTSTLFIYITYIRSSILLECFQKTKTERITISLGLRQFEFSLSLSFSGSSFSWFPFTKFPHCLLVCPSILNFFHPWTLFSPRLSISRFPLF